MLLREHGRVLQHEPDIRDEERLDLRQASQAFLRFIRVRVLRAGIACSALHSFLSRLDLSAHLLRDDFEPFGALPPPARPEILERGLILWQRREDSRLFKIVVVHVGRRQGQARKEQPVGEVDTERARPGRGFLQAGHYSQSRTRQSCTVDGTPTYATPLRRARLRHP